VPFAAVVAGGDGAAAALVVVPAAAAFFAATVADWLAVAGSGVGGLVADAVGPPVAADVFAAVAAVLAAAVSAVEQHAAALPKHGHIAKSGLEGLRPQVVPQGPLHSSQGRVPFVHGLWAADIVKLVLRMTLPVEMGKEQHAQRSRAPALLDSLLATGLDLDWPFDNHSCFAVVGGLQKVVAEQVHSLVEPFADSAFVELEVG